MTAEKGGTHLHGTGSQRQRGANADTIDNAAGGDDRQPHRLYYLWQQGKGALLQAEIVLEEMAAMAAGLQPLGDDGIGAMVGKPAGFCDRGGAGQYLGPAGFHPNQQLGLGQPEMETDHGRFELGHHGGMFGIERGPARGGCAGSVAHAVFVIVGRQPLQPAGLGGGIRRLLPMAEEVDVEWPLPARRQPGQLFAQGGEAQHGRGQ